jgi:cytochrome c oxidase assembly protein Cox11
MKWLRWWHLVVVVGLVGLAFGGWIYWRYTAPIEVRLTASVGDLPFTVQTIPPVLEVQPGQMVSVTFRIRNNDILPLEAYGKLFVEPTSATDQVKVYITQCGGLNAFQNSFASDYLVLFRVQPAGLTGQQQITLHHTFTRVVDRR